MAKNPLIRSYPKRVSKPLPNKSAGILDDYAVRKVVATKEGSITRAPIDDIDIANKLYVDSNDFWNRFGTILSPKTTGDDIDLGSGYITTTGDGTFETIIISNEIKDNSGMKIIGTGFSAWDGTDYVSMDFGNRAGVEIDGSTEAFNWRTPGEVDFLSSDITTTGKGTFGDTILNGSGVGKVLKIYQGGDADGIILYGYDDRSTEFYQQYISGTGNTLIYASRALVFASNTGRIDFTSSQGGTFRLGDAVGGYYYQVTDSGNNAKFRVYSNGRVRVYGYAQIGDGGTTDYTEIKTDGEIELHGTARVKKKIYIGANGIKAPGAKPATFVEDGLTGCWEFADATEANQESVSGTFLISSDMDITVAPTLNVGWHANGVSPGNCKWQLEYLWTSPNEDVTAVAQETLTIVSTASATSDGLIVAEFTGIDLPSATDKAMFWKVTRLSGDVQDTISIATHMRGQFFEYTANKLGEAI